MSTNECYETKNCLSKNLNLTKKSKENFKIVSSGGSRTYWNHVVTLAEHCFIIVTVCIFRYKFFIKEKRPKSRIILTWKWKRYHTWPREFSRNICSNDHETSIPRSLNIYFELLLLTMSRWLNRLGRGSSNATDRGSRRGGGGDVSKVSDFIF